MKNFILALLIFLHGSSVICQERVWTLEECISYAVTNNIQLQLERLQTDINRADLLQSRMSVVPSLNLGSDGRIGFGRSVDPVTNLITFKQNISHSYYITSGITLFNGFAILNTISANKFMLKAGIEAEKVARNSLIIDIMGQYYQVIYTKGLERASKMQLESSESQLNRITKMVQTGKEALSRQYEMESKVSSYRLDYTVTRNAANQALTTLKQMLRLETDADFDIAVPDLENYLITSGTYNTDSVYNIAAEVLPRLKTIEYQLKASKKELAVARGNVAPRLTAGGQLFTGYYRVLGDDNGDQISYSTQLKNNNSQTVFLSLEIPLFNNYRTGRSIKVARINRDQNELRLEQEKLNLFTDIENACLNYNRGLDEYNAAIANHAFNIKSFEAVEKRFEAGLVDVTDYGIASTTLFQAETESLRTKLQLMIHKLTIQFYTSGEYQGLKL